MATIPLPVVQQPQPSTQSQRWRPGPFDIVGELDKRTLDVAWKAIFDHSYGLEQSSVQSVVPGSRMASGALTVTGQMNAVATGLSTLSNVTVSVDSKLTPTNLWVTAQPSASQPGAFDVAVFQPTSASVNTPVLATVPAIVRWHAFGT
jgi:hypothetical protein